ncbi:hypothetical protein GQ53DRAFT_674939 [Thozetella sp. PMI_491]|nr:hypothetical protein GQ53DRAFT_674939 [Thozetella sp. PMI_491]
MSEMALASGRLGSFVAEPRVGPWAHLFVGVSGASASNPNAIDNIQPAGGATQRTPRVNTSIAASRDSRPATDRIWKTRSVSNFSFDSPPYSTCLVAHRCRAEGAGSLQEELDTVRSQQHAPEGSPGSAAVAASPACVGSAGELHMADVEQSGHYPEHPASLSPITQGFERPLGVTSRPPLEQPPLPTSLRTRRIAGHKPPMDLVFSLVALFFRHIHPWLPFLDAQRVFSEMGAGAEDAPLLCYALFGISLPFSFDSRLTLSSCDSFWKYGKRRIFVEVLEEPSYASLEALTILVLDLSGMTNGPQVWGALAVAVKLAVQLKTLDGRVLRSSLSETEAHESPHQQSAELNRRKLFWAIYTLDCYISMTTSHPSGLAEYHIAHFIPTRQATWSIDNQPEGTAASEASSAMPTSIFSYQLGLLDISRAIHSAYLDYSIVRGENSPQDDFWPQKFATCANSLEEWLRVLPQNLQTMLDNASLRPSSSRLGSQLAAHQITSRDKCARSVESLVRIVNNIPSGQMDKLGWPFGWAIWVAARYILIAEHHGLPPSQQGYFEALLRSLKASARYWQVSGKYWRLLVQARSEQESGGVIPNNGVLRFLLDQRAATSDLEDRFRCDPFFNDTSRQRDDSAQSVLQYLQDPFGSFASGELDQLLPEDMAFVIPSDATYPWFSGPLNASSAYQSHHSIPFADQV